jgi:hypothetical protein
MDTSEERINCLERLAQALKERGLVAEVADTATVPLLAVANAEVPALNQQVFCRENAGTWWYWWPWEQPIGPIEDLDVVVERVASVLRSVGTPDD